ncbi:MAG: DUF819 family protein [Prolixibacteraceae bacterium]|nr:DUF819 family protein [Prolixibacteraceae bacterium]
MKRIGAIVLAYAIGLIAGNTSIIPSPGVKFREFLKVDSSLSSEVITQLIQSGQLQQSDFLINQVLALQNLIMTIAIPLAIPLLLFSLDIRKWLKLAKGALLSLVLALISLLVAVVVGYFIFRSHIDESSVVAGMLVGVYTGGTLNLAAIGGALNVSSNTYILTHTYDLIIGSVALFFLMTVAQRLFHTFLPKFGVVHKAENLMQLEQENNDMENFDQLFNRSNFPDMLKAFGVAVLIFAVGGGFSLLFAKPNDSVVAILAITTLGLIASVIKPVNRLKNSFPLGMYFIIVFSLVISSLANLSNMAVDFEETIHLFYFVLLVVAGSMVIHVGLSRIFKVDADTTIIAITALTYSPPFVPTVAGAIKNKNVIISGLAIGILGYAFGSYLGILIGKLLGA